MAKAKDNRTSGETQVTRRNILIAAPFVLAAGAVPVAAVPADPMVDLSARYVAAFHAWEAAMDEEGNLDSPAVTECARMKDDLAAQIEAQPITTDEGFAAYLRYVHTENFMRDEGNPFPDLPRAAWVRIMGWAEARALIGGAA